MNKNRFKPLHSFKCLFFFLHKSDQEVIQKYLLENWFSIGTILYPQCTFDNCEDIFGWHSWRGAAACITGWRPGMLLNISQFTAQPPPHPQHHLVQNVTIAEVKKLRSKRHVYWCQWSAQTRSRVALFLPKQYGKRRRKMA